MAAQVEWMEREIDGGSEGKTRGILAPERVSEDASPLTSLSEGLITPKPQGLAG